MFEDAHQEALDFVGREVRKDEIATNVVGGERAGVSAGGRSKIKNQGL